ncbi:ATP-binding protein [Streptomyces sp. NPDC059247]|uniref:ATP-binding protein n=1 Tax=Streptomyces sp. NPDC059247 TaxID=3346790 RepID=UPI0036D17D86
METQSAAVVARSPGGALEVALRTRAGSGAPAAAARVPQPFFEVVALMPAELRAVCRVRGELLRLLVGSGLSEVADAVVLGASELMANAVTHGCRRQDPAQFSLRVEHSRGRVRVEVGDPSRVRPFPRLASDDSEGGRGLLLVAALADRWGVRLEPCGGKTVWLELDVPGKEAVS